ncbi:drug/metabolite transporter (DMT)-like permease [Crossiella equi]|uniref:Drug/metabolite transporter (DMT)-like permease n=1 Tax=Crossiella equi TaxID=130796 RepID=A0ABS5AI55_9PSEU|nr:EamA family transporter [Crossiella equi]MBP2476246.1 drug/metabolite transporter (DMT)-like permease [Crossiella equi]
MATSKGNLVRLGLLALFWGSSFLWIKYALTAFSPVQIVLIRLVLGTAVLVAVLSVRKLRLPTGRKLWLHLTVAAFFANVLPFTLFGIGELTVDSGMAGVLNATTPLWTLLLGLVVGQTRRLGFQRAIGLALGFAGTLVIFAPWEGAASELGGAIAITGAAASYAVGALYIAHFLAKEGLAPVVVSAAQLLAATVMTAVAVPFAGLQPVHLSWQAVGAVAVLGIFGTGIAYIFFYRIITDEGPTSATSVTYLMPVVSVLLGGLVRGEEVGLRVVAGMVIVLVGIVLSRHQPKAAAAAPEPLPVRAAATAGD